MDKQSEAKILASVHALADTMGARLKAAFLYGVEKTKSLLNLKLIENWLNEGRIDLVFDMVNVELINEGFSAFSGEMTEAFLRGGELSASHMPPFEGANGVKINVNFDAANPNLARMMRDYKAKLITEITNDQRDVIREILTKNTLAGKSPRVTAVEIKDSIGLTVRQKAAVENYRAMLENKPMESLGRELRDKRFDSSVVNAIKRKETIPAEKIDKMVAAYERKYLKYRAETIARTEAMRATSMANQQIWVDAVNEGKIAKERVRRFWIATNDGRTRPQHATHGGIPSMNPNGVAIDEPFKVPYGGFIRFPHDPAARGSLTINCRCTVFFRIVG